MSAHTKQTACIVLAAGQSRRMRSSFSKVFHDLSGRTVLGHVVHTLNQLPLAQIIIVASPKTLMHNDYGTHTVVIQNEQLGTGHAVMTGLSGMQSDITDILIVCGDVPLITAHTLHHLLESVADFTLLKAKLPESDAHLPYGRIVFDGDKPTHIIEYKDADDTLRKSLWINPGVYKIGAHLLQTLLPKLSCDNAAGEYYLTDLLHMAVEAGATTKALPVDFDEILGVNTRAELEQANTIIQQRLIAAHRENGVTFQQSSSVHLYIDTQIGQDTVIEPFVTFGKGVVIDANVRIKSFSYLSDCTLKSGVTVGPFAHIRGGVTMESGAEVGNFVELKATHMGKKAKAKHLTYLGDATIGDGCNIGAGTITANYDGFQKYKTIIADCAHIGAHTVLVAPVKVGEGAITAAGSVITADVPDHALAIGRALQINKPGWATVYKERKRLNGVKKDLL